MRFFILLLAIFVSSAGTIAAQPAWNPPPDARSSWSKTNPTNGMACAMCLAPDFEKGSPIFIVYIINDTTNLIRGVLRVPLAGRANITLLDVAGNEVPKTALGKSFGVWSDQKIKDWFEDHRQKPPRFLGDRKSVQDSKGISDYLVPQLPNQISAGVSLPQLFELHKSGKYTLSLQLRVAQTKVDKSRNVSLELLWLPTLMAQIPVSAEEITTATNRPGQ
jgi:hypothetical protein